MRLVALLFGIISALCLSELLFSINLELQWLSPKKYSESSSPHYDSASTEHARTFLRDIPPGLSHPKLSTGPYPPDTIHGNLKCVPSMPYQACRSIVLTTDTHEIAYDVTYHVDDKVRRSTPFSKDSERAILFFGDSFTFGSGVEDDETFESALARMRPQDRILNLGVPGSSPAMLLSRLKSGKFRQCDGIKAEKRAAVYTYLGFMAERILAPVSAMRSDKAGYTLHSPHYALDDSGALTLLGTFGETRPVRNLIYGIVAHSATFDFFQPFLPPINSADLVLIRKILEEIGSELRDHCGVERFVVSFFPGTENYLVKELAGHIETFDFTAIDRAALLGERDIIRSDGHPTPLSYYLYASLLNERLQ